MSSPSPPISIVRTKWVAGASYYPCGRLRRSEHIGKGIMAMASSYLFCHLTSIRNKTLHHSTLHEFPCTAPGIPLFRICNKIGIEGQPGQGPAVADDHQLLARPGHGHIHPADIRQEADFALRVAPGQAYIDDIAFLSLEAVDGIDGYFVSISLQDRRVLQQFPKQVHLPPVGRD